MWSSVIAAVLVALLAALMTAPTPAIAETGADLVKALEPVLDKARESGATVIVVDPNKPPAKAAAAPEKKAPSLTDKLQQARTEFVRIMAKSGGLLPSMAATLRQASPDGTSTWLLWAIGMALIAIAIGEFVRRRVAAWGRNRFLKLYDPNPKNRSSKIGYLLSRAVLMLIGAGLFFVVAELIASFAPGEHGPTRTTAQILVFGVTLFLIVRVVLLNVLSPDVGSHRMINLSDHDAGGIYRGGLFVVIVAVISISVCGWMDNLGISRDAHKLALIAAMFLTATAISIAAILFRGSVHKALISAEVDGGRTTFGRLLASNWHILIIVYVVIAWAVSSARLILDYPSATGLVAAPVYVLIGGLVVYAIGLLIIDRVFASSEKEADIANVSRDAGHAGTMTHLPDDVIDAEIDGVESVASDARTRNDFRDLIEHGLSILVVLGGIATVVSIWSIDAVNQSNWVSRIVDLAIVIFIAYMAYRATVIWIDRQIEEEDPTVSADPGESEMGHGGGSRLATLLPIFRNFLLISIVVIAAMIGLSELGVDIGPLFAGAGVVGLAIGFGAQTLVRDIFSGAFFLMNDAFRKGEYIDLGSVKGTVEKISIRSFQLRHHNGPLNTVPFGEIKQLTNYSRDWVLMKLPLRVTYDTDVEKVRKLIKKLGQELLEDEDVGHLFLQPLKSQGVNVMEDSAMIIRVKFMTKPGDQFIVRRVVYTRIRELFEREGIKFAHREVTVRIAEDEHDDHKPLTHAQKEAIAGAVLPTIEEQGKGSAPVDDRG